MKRVLNNYAIKPLHDTTKAMTTQTILSMRQMKTIDEHTNFTDD